MVNGDFTQWMTPGEFPKPSDGKVIWFLDEINAGSRATMASAMQLLLDRRTSNYQVPDEVIMIGAGNRSYDKSVANAMPAALSNRLLHFQVMPDVGEFIDYGLANNIPLEILNFLRYRPELIFQAEKGKDIMGFPSPRSWHMAAKQNIMKAGPFLRKTLVEAAVGHSTMLEFEGFLDLFDGLPSLSDILMNPTTANLPVEPSSNFAVITALVAKAAGDNIEAIITYFGRLGKEFATLGMKDISRLKPELQNTAAFTRWEIANHNNMR